MTAGRLTAVSLQEVPLQIRERAARPLMKRLAADGGVASLAATIELQRAVYRPTPRRYYLPEDAVRAVLG
jgi:hypothetical protein